MPSPANRVHSLRTWRSRSTSCAAYRLKLRDKDIGLDGAEKSCLNQLEKIKAQKAAYNKDKPAAALQTEGTIPTPTPKATMPPKPQVYNLEEDDHTMLPGRKGRKTETAEELEAKQREEAVDSPGSFTVISS